MGKIEFFALSALFNLRAEKFFPSYLSLVPLSHYFTPSRWKWTKFSEQYKIKGILSDIFHSMIVFYKLKQSLTDTFEIKWSWHLKYTDQWHVPPALFVWLVLLVATTKKHSKKQALIVGTKQTMLGPML